MDKFTLVYEFNKNSPLITYQAAKEIEAKNYSRALEMLSKATEKFPDHLTAFLLLSEALAFNEKFDEARDVLKKSLDLDADKETYEFYLNRIETIKREFEGISINLDDTVNEILNEANILKVTGVSSLLTRGLSSTSVQKDGRRITIYRNKVDVDFLETLQIKLTAGRNFLENSQSDIQNSIIVNEAFVRELELKTPLGAPLEYKRISPVDNPVIIGIVEDFNLNTRIWSKQ